MTLPTTPQLERIQDLSADKYGDPMAAFKKHYRPQTVEEADNLIARLSTSRVPLALDVPAPAATPDIGVKPCRGCGLTKPFDDFHINRALKDGRETNCKTCKAAQAKARRAAKKKDIKGAQKPSKTSKPKAEPADTPADIPQPVPAVPPPVVTVNPTLSEMRKVQQVLGQWFPAEQVTLEVAAGVIEAVIGGFYE